ncbi:MAG TPA: Clp protease N-terminal domain-containing protein [Thermomicrobiales bacterium]
MQSFTSCAQNALDNAKEEARRLGHSYCGTEHLVIALARDERSVAGQMLSSLGINADSLRSSVAFIVGQGEPLQADEPEPAMTPRLQRIIEAATKEAEQREDASISTLHLLLALLKEREGLAVMLLEAPGVGLERIGGAMMRALRDELADPA